MQSIEEKEGRVLLRVRVQPKASRNELILEPNGRVRAALTAPPVEGAANKALRDFLSKALGLPKNGIELVAGERGREKTLALKGLTAAEARRRLKREAS